MFEDVKKARDRIAPYIRPTPFIPFEHMSKRTGKDIWMKCETLQRTGSFKIRGAANFLLENLGPAKKSGVIAASAGNHAQGVAAMCSQLGISATIIMPEFTPTIKVQNTTHWGAHVELKGETFHDSYQRAQKLAQEKGYLFIHPYNDPLIQAGQGTIALEMVEEESFKGLEAVVIAVGGGGLLCGCATVFKRLAPHIKIYGVSAENAPATWRSVQTGEIQEIPPKHTIAEGVATKKTEKEMLKLLKDNLTDFFSISEDSIAYAISTLAEHSKLMVEGAGALPIAALINERIPENKVAVILSGGNIDLSMFSNALQRGLVEQGRLVRLLIWIPDRPGGLNSVTEILAQFRANILQVLHQRMTLHTAFGNTEIEIDMETRGKEHTEEIINALQKSGIRVKRL